MKTILLKYLVGLVVIFVIFPWLSGVGYTFEALMHSAVFALGIPLSEMLISHRSKGKKE